METLSTSKDFNLIFKCGRKIDAGPIRLWYLQKKTKQVRVCFIGRSKKAVKRNRIRRRLREGFREHFYPLLCNCCYDFIFMSDERLINAKSNEILLWMGKLLENIGVLNGAGLNSDD